MDFPTEREELRELLWEHLQDRLRDRRAKGVDLGVRSDKLKGRERPFLNGNPAAGGESPTDVHLGTGGTTLISCLIGVFASDPWHADKAQQGRILIEEVYELVHLGILRPDHESEREAHFFITPHGAKCLEVDDRRLSPLSEKWVDALKARFGGEPDLGLLVIHYREALDAYRAGLDLSAMVMIGACYELGLRKVASEIAGLLERRGGSAPGANSGDRQLLRRINAGDPVMADPLAQMVDRVLLHGLRRDLGRENHEWAKFCLSPSLLFVRKLRNNAGHPTGEVVSRDMIYNHILLFSDHYARMTSIAETIKDLS